LTSGTAQVASALESFGEIVEAPLVHVDGPSFSLLNQAALHSLDGVQTGSGELEEVAGADRLSRKAATSHHEICDASARGREASKPDTKEMLAAIAGLAC